MAAACPKCGKTPGRELAAGESRCPHCGAELAVEVFSHTQALTPDDARAAASGLERPEPPRPTQFAHYQIVDELGRGGMGVVYKAYDPELRRTVALKVLLSAEHASKDEIERFFREASSAAKLQHPNIVPIHELKIHEGRHYYTMDFIEGQSLDALIRARRLNVRQGLELLEKVARALDHAHSKGIVHRDLKPQNIIVAPDGEPKVTDFGLAKVLTSDEGTVTAPGLTSSGVAMGTPYYEAPEQAAGRSKEVDARTDVYALGCILYELLVGSPPFAEGSALEILRQQVEADPVPPTRRGAKVAADVETICLKCLEKDPARRYPSAGELAADLRRFLDGEPITGRRASVLYIARKKLFRHRVVAAVVAVAAVALVASTVWYVLHLREKEQVIAAERDSAVAARGDANRQRVRAQTEERLAKRRLYVSNIALAHRCVGEANVEPADELLRDCPPELRNWEWGRVRREAHQEAATLTGHAGHVQCAAFSADGRTLASGGDDRTVRLWDSQTRRLLHTLEGHGGAVRSLAFAPDGKLLASAGLDGTVRLWEVETGRAVRTLTSPSPLATPAYSVAFRPDSRQVAAASGLILIGEVAGKGGLAPVLESLASLAVSVAYSPDGKLLASGSETGAVTLWDAAGTRMLQTLKAHDKRVRALAFGAQGRRLASASDDGTVRVWDVPARRELLTLAGHVGEVFGVAFSADGSRLATCGEDKTVRVWDGQDGARLLTLKGHSDPVRAVAFSPDGRRLVSGGFDKVLKLWELETARDSLVLEAGGAGLSSLAFAPQGAKLAAGTTEGDILVWDAAAGRKLATLRGHSGAAAAVAFTADGSRLYSGGADATVRAWEPGTGEPLLKAAGGAGAVAALAVSPDGKLVAFAGSDARVRIWDARADRLLRELAGHRAKVRGVAFSPDGRLLASCGDDRTVRTWEAATGRGLRTLEGHSGEVSAVAFSPDGRRVASAGQPDKIVIVWDVQSGRRFSTLKGHASWVRCVAFSPDGQRVASGSYDRTVKIWETDTGRELLTLRGHGDLVRAVAFSRDGRLLASAANDKTIRVWPADDWTQPESQAGPKPPAAREPEGY